MPDLLQSLCSTPTAPFAEQRVVEFVADFVRRRKNLSLRADRFGNLLIELKSKSKSRRPRWVFTAHMDHPGFVARRMLNSGQLLADFRGYVKVDFVRGAAVRFFDAPREIPGIVKEATVADHDQLPVPHQVTVQVDAPVAPGSPGMFDQGEGRYESGKFYCRGCDDLAGAAACLEMLDRLHRRPTQSPVAVLFTRAEEEGFIGCIAACRDGKLLKKSDRVIAIECSSVQPVAPQGGGVIVRVGDRSSIFNSALTYFLGAQAAELQKKDKSFRWQRALMPGGTCEATVYDIYGYTAASLCVPLGNYHNMDTQSQKIAPEYIDVSDWQNMVKLFVRLAQHGHKFNPGHAQLKARVLKRYNRLNRFLTASAKSVTDAL
ncbi:MAG: M20/M25/M40 family metallo-hydrolase [Tepidisphaeraceae bacterium]|jgi:endoglucanase